MAEVIAMLVKASIASVVLRSASLGESFSVVGLSSMSSVKKRNNQNVNGHLKQANAAANEGHENQTQCINVCCAPMTMTLLILVVVNVMVVMNVLVMVNVMAVVVNVIVIMVVVNVMLLMVVVILMVVMVMVM